METFTEIEIVAMCKALGDPTRLRIFTFLREQCGCVALDTDGAARPIQGLSVGEVCCSVFGEERITSTISHHLKELRLAKLIQMERRGKFMICCVNTEAVKALIAYLGGTVQPPTIPTCC